MLVFHIATGWSRNCDKVVNGCRNRPKTMFSWTEQGEKRKTTLKMKPHRVRKPFQLATGHSIKTVTILQSIHMHQNNYTQHIAIWVTPSTLRLNKKLVQSTRPASCSSSNAFVSGTGGSEVQISCRSNRTQCCQRLATVASFLRKELGCPGAMTRRWAPPTRYTLRRITASIIKDLIWFTKYHIM